MAESRHEFFGRRSELAQLARAIGTPGDGIRCVYVHGASGIGKSSLVRHVQDSQASEFDAHWIVGRGFVASAPGKAISEAYPALNESLVGGTRLDSYETLYEAAGTFRDFILRLAIGAAQLIVVDDIQALDATSLTLLAGLADSPDDADVSIVFIEQTDFGKSFNDFQHVLQSFAAKHVLVEIEVGPLDAGSISEIAIAIAGEITPDIRTQFIERAMGNPACANEFARALLAEGKVPQVPESAVAAARVRLNKLNDDERSMVEMLAVADSEGVPTSWLRSSAEEIGLNTEAAFTEVYSKLVSYGICQPLTDEVGLAHPFLHRAMCESLSRATVRALRKEWLIALEPLAPEPSVLAAMADHLFAIDNLDQAARMHESASDHFHACGDANAALSQLRRAVDIEAGILYRIVLAKKAVRLAIHIGSPSAESVIDEMVRLATIVGDGDALACGLLNKFWLSTAEKDLSLLDRAVVVGGDASGWAHRSAASRCFVEARDEEEAIQHDELAIQFAQANGDIWLEIWAQLRLAVSLSTVGRLAESIAMYEKTIAQAAEEGMHNIVVDGLLNCAADYGDLMQATRATESVKRVRNYVASHSIESFNEIISVYSGLFLQSEGKLEAARSEISSFAEGLDAYIDTTSILVAYAEGSIALDLGDLAVAGKAIETLTEFVNSYGITSDHFLCTSLRIRYAELCGDYATMVDLVQSLPVIDQPNIVFEFALWSARASLWHDGSELLDCARSLAVQLRASNAPTAVATLAEIDAIVACDSEAFAACIKTWKEAGRRLDMERCSLAQRKIVFDRGTDEPMGSSIVEVHSSLRRMGATLDADRAARLGRETGTQLRSRQEYISIQSGHGVLTDRDWQVLDLLAHGLTNSQIARRLLIAESTLTGRLTDLYKHSGVDTRVQLVHWAECQGR